MFHKEGAYDGFDSLAEVAPHYKRCREPKHFILSDEGIVKERPICAHCGNVVTVASGNRCQYYPKLGKLAVLCYECSWKVIFIDLAKLSFA